MLLLLLVLNNRGLYASWDSPNFLTKQPEGSIKLQRKIGDHLMHFINLSAVVIVVYHQDLEGFKQYLASMGITAMTTQMLKFSVARYRPDNTNQDSFPSGHSSFSYSGASFIYDRYGKQFGIPLYVLATYVAYSRVVAKKHYISDVIAGSILAIGMAKLLTTPYNVKIGHTVINITHSPIIHDNYFGISVTASF